MLDDIIKNAFYDKFQFELSKEGLDLLLESKLDFVQDEKTQHSLCDYSQKELSSILDKKSLAYLEAQSLIFSLPKEFVKKTEAEGAKRWWLFRLGRNEFCLANAVLKHYNKIESELSKKKLSGLIFSMSLDNLLDAVKIDNQLGSETMYSYNCIVKSSSYLKKFEIALEYSQKARKLGDNSIANKRAMGSAYLGLKQYENALDCFLEISDKKTDDISKISNIYLKLGKYEKALRGYIEISENNNGLKESQNFYNASRIGVCYYKLGKYDKAIEFLEYAVNDKSPSYSTVRSLAMCYFDVNKRNVLNDLFKELKTD